MNCKQVQDLLPLYVGRDLEENREKLVIAHLQSCAECGSSAEEYREAQQLLQLFEPPLFSDAVYAGIRQRVLREIGRESAAPTLPRLVASLFRPRIRWAVATALLLAVSVIAFYFINRRNDRQQVVDSRVTVDRTTQDEQADARSRGNVSASPSPSSEANNGTLLAGTGPKTGADATIAGGTHQSQQRKSSGAAVGRTRPSAVSTSDNRSTTAAASPNSNNLVAPDALPARDPAASEKTLRVEMQTKDRNIRIIWFSPQRAKQNSPGKSQKGIQEVRSYA